MGNSETSANTANTPILNGHEGSIFSREIDRFTPNPDVEDFRRFVLDHFDELERARKNGRDLSSVIYSSFYNRNRDDKSVSIISPTEYQDSLDTLSTNLNRRGIKFQHGDKDFNWFMCMTNGGHNYSLDTYRVYFNLKPESLAYVFEQLAAYCKSWGVRATMKIPEVGSKQMLSRMDKMVMYYNASEAEVINKILLNIHKYNHDKFEKNGVPRFTKKLRGIDGISVGQEPVGSRESFGKLRCRILSEVYEEYIKSVEIGHPLESINFQYVFRYLCIKYGVNPDEPAFNLPVGYERN